MPKRYRWRAGDRVTTADGEETDWMFVGEAGYKGGRRRVRVCCVRCRKVAVRYVYNLTRGRSMRCENCRGDSIRSEESLRNSALSAGLGPNYFLNLRERNPEAFEALRRIGGGNPGRGYEVVRERYGRGKSRRVFIEDILRMGKKNGKTKKKRS